MSTKNYPPYIKLGTTAMFWDANRNQYWRSAGAWGCHVKEKNGKLFSDIPLFQYIHNIELVEITKEEHDKDNGKYAFIPKESCCPECGGKLISPNYSGVKCTDCDYWECL